MPSTVVRGACERLLARLVVASWEDRVTEERHSKSRRLLAPEYLRRMAIWADALGVPMRWPFFELAVVFDPSVETDPVWLQHWRPRRELGTRGSDMFRWASSG